MYAVAYQPDTTFTGCVGTVSEHSISCDVVFIHRCD